MTTQEIIATLNNEQKLLLADTIVYGEWGDTDLEFEGEETGGMVFCPNDAWQGNHFDRKELSAKFKELYKALGLTGDGKWFKSTKNGVIHWHKDWWEDGSSSALIIRYDVYKELDKWAREYVKQYDSNNQ